ncbi:hypothetical protein HN257_17425 [Acinetobacter baumannii]|nr:hypothetical protein [Acinetobacter baumannii]
MKVQPNDYSKIYDIAVIGGGINGVGIANDAAGRGLSVFWLYGISGGKLNYFPLVNIHHLS